MATRQIVAMGGGGFSMADSVLDDYVLALTRKDRPRVCFLPTASGDSREHMVNFYEAFPAKRAEVSHLPLFGAPREDTREFLLSQEVIYVGGGWLVRAGAPWRMMPNDLPAWEAVHQQTQRWIAAGVFESMVHDLRELLRVASGRAPDPAPPSSTAARCHLRPRAGIARGTTGPSARRARRSTSAWTRWATS